VTEKISLLKLIFGYKSHITNWYLKLTIQCYLARIMNYQKSHRNDITQIMHKILHIQNKLGLGCSTKTSSGWLRSQQD
jgi:hypothetical protein